MEDNMPKRGDVVTVRIIKGRTSLIGRTTKGTIGLLADDLSPYTIAIDEVWEVKVVWAGKQYFIFKPIQRLQHA